MHKIQIKFRNWALLFATICVAGAGLLVTSCEGKEEEDTKVVLQSFGPMPIARGAELKFIGLNLDRVTAVVLPDNLTITSFTKKEPALLTLTVPQEAVPGFVVLKTPDGDITTKTTIGFSEPISIAGFTPATVKTGDVLTITGDYLNLVGEVILTDRVTVTVDDFTSHTRTEIKLVVPAEAQTGKIAVSNAEEEPIIVYSAASLNVMLPAFTTVAPNPVKAGTTLTITGTNLDLVLSVELGGGKVIAAEDFDSHTATQIVISVPEDTKDGKVIMVPASGVEVATADDLVMVIPTVAVTPVTLKNGQDITVTGTNLDLIYRVNFGGNKQGTIKAGGTATEILVTVPDDAVDGVVSFVTRADKEITGPNLTMIVPAFSSFSPTSAKPNSNLVITGTDLDLVTTVAFTGDIEGTIGPRSETSLTVTVPVGAKTGLITLVAKNGTTVTSAIDLTVLTNLPNFTSFSEPKGTPGAILTLNGTNMLLIKELVFPGGVYATAFGEKTDTKVEVYVPLNVEFGEGQIRMITYEGDEGLLPEIFFGRTDPITPQTIMVNDFDQHGDHNGYWDESWTDNTKTEVVNEAGNLYMKVTGTLDGWIFACNHQANGALGPVITDIQNYNLKLDVKYDEGVTGAENAAMQFVFAGGWYWYGPGLFPASTYGDWVTISIPATALNLSGTLNLSSGDVGLSGGPVPGGISFDNLRFDPK
jgi:hypothetical protein